MSLRLSETVAYGAAGEHVRIDDADIGLVEGALADPFGLTDEDAIGQLRHDRRHALIGFLVCRRFARYHDEDQTGAAGDRVEGAIDAGSDAS